MDFYNAPVCFLTEKFKMSGFKMFPDKGIVSCSLFKIAKCYGMPYLTSRFKLSIPFFNIKPLATSFLINHHPSLSFSLYSNHKFNLITIFLQLERIRNLNRHSPPFPTNDPDRFQILHHPIRSSGNDLFHSMARHQSNDFTASRFTSLNTRRRILQHEDLSSAILKIQLLQTHAVAGRIRLAVCHGLRSDEMLRDSER